ncbi:MAG: hypothetical protein A2W05_00865 [Candidatus Schekmanbacteria bacterium RBG_16_38_10]|uniref:histidine kinase n=1 Tax=Candidatus Schekmanbacteria bacterium RBG_16_38_10 TaxID=1817879 RepID=A0A1F7RUC5_9BACT|nr:MAG: hypothetical protein A2W05_00865 [Candidatus Schekmanbacteria bacterium RBG_16_38_10]
MNFYRNIRFKLVVWYMFILCLILIPFSTYLYLSLKKSLNEQLNYELKLGCVEVIEDVNEFLKTNELEKLSKDNSMETLLDPISDYVLVFDRERNLIYKSDKFRKHSQILKKIKLNKNYTEKSAVQDIKLSKNRSIRVMTARNGGNGTPEFYVQVGLPLKDIEYPLNRLLITLIIALPATLIVSSILGWFFVYKSLKPIDDITKAAMMIGVGDFNQRLRPIKNNDEVGRLVNTFNNMISKLDESFKQICQFTADVSHELRTPLTIIKGEIEVTLKKVRTSEEYKRTLEVLLEEVDGMTKIVEDLLFLERADSGIIKLNILEINLDILLKDICEQFRNIVDKKKLKLSIDINSGNAVIKGDASQIKKVFVNLLDNAVKYTNEGGEIVISVSDLGKYMKITFSDTGIGIPPEELPFIFERFYRVDRSRTADTGGSGLGLSICETIVKAHKGTIEVKSNPSSGTTFEVCLPKEILN